MTADTGVLPPTLPHPPLNPTEGTSTIETNGTILLESDTLVGNINPPTSSPNAILAQACTTLEKLRSLHCEREACELFASSLLAHPFGARIVSSSGGTENNDPDAEWATWGMRTSEILALQQHQQQLQRMKNSKIDAAASQFLDPLYPNFLPGGVQDAWSALVRSARPVIVSDGVVEEEGASSAVADDYDLADLIANRGTGGGDIITADMIERILSREKKQDNEDYTLQTSGRLSVACRTKALHAAIDREGQLVQLLEKEAMTDSDNILEVAKREVEGMAHRGSELMQHYHPDTSAGVAPCNLGLMNSFYARLNDVKRYHSHSVIESSTFSEGSSNNLESLHNVPTGGMDITSTAKFLLSGRKRKHGHPIADGYDIASFIASETTAVRIGEVYTPEEMYGLYLDLIPIYEEHARNLRHAFAVDGDAGDTSDENNEPSSSSNNVLSYIDFLAMLSKGLNTSISEPAKLRDRRKYVRFLRALEKYLTGFLKRTSPFLDVNSEIIATALQIFDTEWTEKGGVDGWEYRLAEAPLVLISSGNISVIKQSNKTSIVGIDLGKYANSSELAKDVSGDELKAELVRLGLKCGGTVADRAARLFLTKDTPLDKLPTKVFVKKVKGTNNMEESKSDLQSSTTTDVITNISLESVITDRRVDIARLEAIVTALLDQLRPTLEGTRRRIERRMTQTDNERDQEIDEEINGTQLDTSKVRSSGVRDGRGEGGGVDADDEDDEDDTPIYNPKNVPLGWDGKPIPYWLFKLHGLNHFYPCEICGNESYRGRRNFEKHFTESRHSYGMRCLSIPNTKHFHGVTKIADALELWGRLRKVLEGNQFDVDQEEEYEDSHGNVVNRAQYEDLARQGLL